MLGGQIGPKEQTLVIRQVVRQYLESYLRRCILRFLIVMDGIETPSLTYMDSPSIYSYNTLVAGLILQSACADW